MVLLGVLLVVLGIRMAQRISAELRTREELLQRAVDASEMERRRIAADLHDGTVQHLAGLSFALAGMAAKAQSAGDTEAATMLTDAAATSRTSVRELRTLLVDIYPPNLAGSGLAPAIADLLAGLDGIEVESDLAEPPDLDPRVRAALYRVARETIANVSKHSGATRVTVRLAREGTKVVLYVADDGQGFDPQVRREGHLGLRLVEDLVESVGGQLTIDSEPGCTSVTVEVEAS
jgi:two-component system, NarL family, sensor kinase